MSECVFNLGLLAQRYSTYGCTVFIVHDSDATQNFVSLTIITIDLLWYPAGALLASSLIPSVYAMPAVDLEADLLTKTIKFSHVIHLLRRM